MTNAPALLDVSNACRDRSLAPRGKPAAWSRVERVVAAWARSASRPARPLGICDENLRFLLSPRDRRQLERAERAGHLRIVAGAADDELLRMAEQSGAAVISKDLFRGHRRRHPWIQGCRDRFYSWDLDGTGAVCVGIRDMGVSSAYSLSEHEEADRLRERGLDHRREADRRALARAYRCTDGECLSARLYPDRLPLPPERRGGQFVCPGCGGALMDLGARPWAAEIVAERGPDELLRLAVEDGQEVELGRSDLRRGGADRLERVSRRHLSLRAHDGQLLVRDLGSRNGTAIAHWNRDTRSLNDPVPVSGPAPAAMGARDALIVAGVVRLRRSGQRFSPAGGTLSAASGGDRPVTTDESCGEGR